MHKSQCRNTRIPKKTRQHVSTKSQQFTINDLNDCEEEEISNNELKRTVIKMINKIEEDMCKHVNEFKEDADRQLNELKEIANK
jgi:hypothetical protein